jgi:hypothetical protein
MAVVKTVALSLLASGAATYLLRALLSTQSGNGVGAGGDRVVIVIVPIFVGNSSNKIGYVKEVRPIWPWGRE